jgi:hypothetical protein
MCIWEVPVSNLAPDAKNLEVFYVYLISTRQVSVPYVYLNFVLIFRFIIQYHPTIWRYML